MQIHIEVYIPETKNKILLKISYLFRAYWSNTINRRFLVLVAILSCLFCVVFVRILVQGRSEATERSVNWWEVQSIDTMKYSRDLAREKLNDPTFDSTIETQVSNIAHTGATHIAIGTPYDEEFFPMMTRWVAAARRHSLHVWFRGNFSGWEGWFDYPMMTAEEHTVQTVRFINAHPNLFQDGDMFTSCTECENGLLGDPRRTGKVKEYRQFIIQEYTKVRDIFNHLGIQVSANAYSMNGDVAKLVMDPNTTAALDGVVAIDHYVADPIKLASDIRAIAQSSGGRVILSEVGAPVLDIHGEMTDSQQARWVDQVFSQLSQIPELVGINYWVGTGGTTQIWTAGGQRHQAVQIIQNYFSPAVMTGIVSDEYEKPIANVLVANTYKQVRTNDRGEFTIPYLSSDTSILFVHKGYEDRRIHIPTNSSVLTIHLQQPTSGILQWIYRSIRRFIHL